MYSEWSESWGRDAAAMLLAQHPEVDAILCGSDQIARGVLDTARDLHRKVPDDLAVMGFDNWEVLTTNSRPELTSIDANLQHLGRTAALADVRGARTPDDIGAGRRVRGWQASYSWIDHPPPLAAEERRYPEAVEVVALCIMPRPLAHPDIVLRRATRCPTSMCCHRRAGFDKV